jgi:hypothetical protein
LLKTLLEFGEFPPRAKNMPQARTKSMYGTDRYNILLSANQVEDEVDEPAAELRKLFFVEFNLSATR